MTSLDKAIYTQVATLSSLTGGVHWSLAPEGTAMPYCVLDEMDSGGLRYETGGRAIESFPRLFKVFARDRDTAKACIAQIEGLFITTDVLDGTLELDEGQHVGCEKTSSGSILDPDRDEAGHEVTMAHLILEFTVNRLPGEN